MNGNRQHREVVFHDAMSTTFQISAVHADAVYVRQAAAAAFAELDRLENRLSRFLQGSDIFRINRLAAGQATLVHLDTFACLEIAVDVQRATGGAFDVAYASAASPSGGPRFDLNLKQHTIRVLAAGTRLDLGGIGKGFALDRMAVLLGEWEIDSALLCASNSTMLALKAPPGEPGWQIAFGPDHAERRVRLADRAFSASGRAVKGDHIVNPHTGRPADGWLRAWSAAPTAAVADALSTAFMVMTEAEIRAYCRRHPDISAHVLKDPAAAVQTLAEAVPQ